MSAPDKYFSGATAPCRECGSRPCDPSCSSNASTTSAAVFSTSAAAPRPILASRLPVCRLCAVQGCKPGCPNWKAKAKPLPPTDIRPIGRNGVPFIIWDHLIADYQLTVYQHSVLLYVCRETYCRGQPNGAKVSITQIAAALRMSRPAARRAMSALERHGLIEREGEIDSGDAPKLAAILPGYWPVPSE